MKLRFQLFQLNPKAKKKHPELAEDESDVDDEFMERHEAELLEKALQGAEKKWEKDNAKAKENKEKPAGKSELDERCKEIKREFKELSKERESRKVEPKKGGEWCRTSLCSVNAACSHSWRCPSRSLTPQRPRKSF
jgi:DNA topoisomerase-1